MKHAELLEQTPSYYEWQGYLATLDSESLVVDMKVGLPNAASTAQQMLSSRQPQTAAG